MKDGSMKLRKRKPSGREKDGASVKLLERLRKQLYSDDDLTAHRAAFNLSWMQEDGLDILKEALFSDSSGRAKIAAARGLRSMRGRMKKMARDVLEQGVTHSDAATSEACKKALLTLKQRASGTSAFTGKTRAGKSEVKKVRRKRRRRKTRQQARRQDKPSRKRRSS
jgi:hypothetical protein